MTMELESVKLDARDRRLLFELGLDSRQPLGRLAKKLKTSKEVVHYRLQKLIESGVILKLFAHFQPSALGYDTYTIFFRLEGMPAKTEGEMHEFIKNSPESAWAATLSGRFDFVVRICAKDLRGLDSFMARFLAKFGRYIREKQITLRTAQKYTLSPLKIFEEFNPPKSRLTTLFSQPADVNETDKKILNALFYYSRSSFAELGAKAGVSPETAKSRVEALVKNNVITNFSCYINRRKLGFGCYKIFLTLQYPTKERVRHLVEWCENHPCTDFMASCIGPWDLEVQFDTRSPGEFDAILKELRNKFRDVIAEHSWALITKETLYYWP